MKHLKRHLMILGALALVGAGIFYVYRIRQERAENVMVQYQTTGQDDQDTWRYQLQQRKNPAAPVPGAMA